MIILALRDTAAPWEIAWTCLPLFGVLVSLWAISDYWKDLRATNGDPTLDEIDRIAARQLLRNEGIVLLVLLSMVMTGVAAINAEPVALGFSQVAQSFTASYVAISILLPIKTLLNRFDRHRQSVLFREALAQKQEGC